MLKPLIMCEIMKCYLIEKKKLCKGFFLKSIQVHVHVARRYYLFPWLELGNEQRQKFLQDVINESTIWVVVILVGKVSSHILKPTLDRLGNGRVWISL